MKFNKYPMSDGIELERVIGRRYVDDSFQYLVKFKNASYLHTQWIKAEEVIMYSKSKMSAKLGISSFERSCRVEAEDKTTVRIPEIEQFKTVERIVTHDERYVIDDENTLVGWRMTDKTNIMAQSRLQSVTPIWSRAKPPRSVRRGDYFSHQLTEDQLNKDTQEFRDCKFQVLVPHGLKSNDFVYFNCRDAVPMGVNMWRVKGHTSEMKSAPSKQNHIGLTKLYFVKWKDLSYRHATWERGCDIDDDIAIQRYFRRLNMERLKQNLNDENKPHIPLLAPKQFKDNRELRSYQVHGVNWLLRRWFSKSGAILADEMGLGKTVQVVATLEALRKHATSRISKDLRSVGGGPFIVVVPLSVLEHWQREFELWTDMEVCYYYSSSTKGPGMILNGAQRRELKRKYEWHLENTQRPKFDVLLTTYEVLQKDIKFLSRFTFRAMVVDEGHRLRNHQARAKTVFSKIRTEWRLILTGTPLQNNLQELWSLLNFVASEAFADVNEFLRLYGNMENETSQLTALKKKLSSYVLRREKEDVEKSIPAKVETIIDVELTTIQKKYYRAIYEKNRTFLCKGGSGPSLRNVRTSRVRAVVCSSVRISIEHHVQTQIIATTLDYRYTCS